MRRMNDPSYSSFPAVDVLPEHTHKKQLQHNITGGARRSQCGVAARRANLLCVFICTPSCAPVVKKIKTHQALL